MIKKTLGAALVIFFCFAVSPLFAEEGKYELNTAASIRDILKENVGKKISVRLDAGEELEGTVTKIGDQLVQLSRLPRKDFYDALIRIDKITAIIIKVRGN